MAISNMNGTYCEAEEPGVVQSEEGKGRNESRFADAVGVGKGKPYDFLRSLVDGQGESEDVNNIFIRQGIEMEPIIHEAYDLLTGHKTRESGFWTLMDEENPLKDKIGVSPDAIVVDPVTRKSVGVCEFKAPMNTMYRDIPSQYMVQMHGQMAVTGLYWCDFMAVCRLKREIMLKRVHFCLQFWNFVANRLLQFCLAYKEFSSLGSDAASFCGSKNTAAVKQWSVLSQLPFETKIQVTDLLNHSNIPDDFFCGPSGQLMDFDLLMGLNARMEHIVRQRSQEWYNLRKGKVVTGSRFADAVGVGKGKPYDFLRSLVDGQGESEDVNNIFIRQGIEMEPIIHEAYDLLTGHMTRESGFWTLMDEENPLKDKIGVSPDAIVVDPVTRKSVGVCEFKAPMNTMYRDIPSQYMVQMHGQMAVTGSDAASFCGSKNTAAVKQWSVLSQLPFETKIQVTDLLNHSNIPDDFFCGPSGQLMDFDLLMGLNV